jgi:hypothetical protein
VHSIFNRADSTVQQHLQHVDAPTGKKKKKKKKKEEEGQ